MVDIHIIWVSNKANYKVPQSNLKAVIKFKFEKCLFSSLFSNFLSHGTNKLNIYLSFVCCTESLCKRFVLFVALSHCNKQFFLFVALSHCDKEFSICFEKDAQKVQICYIFWYFLLFLAYFVPFWPYLCLFLWFLLIFKKYFGIFVQHIKILFVAVTQCDQKNPFVSVTQCDKQKNLCHSDSEQETNIQFLCGMWQRNWKNPRTNIHHCYQIALGYL